MAKVRAHLPTGGWLTVAGRTRLSVTARSLNTIAWGAGFLYVLSVALGLRGAQGGLTEWQGLLANLAAAAPVGLIALRARTFPECRTAWWWIVAALGLDVWANLLSLVMDPALDPVNLPGWRDVFSVPSYAAMFIGVALLTQQGVGKGRGSARLDGLTVGLGAASVISAIVLRPLLRLDGGPLAIALNLAYPMMDLVLLVLLLAGLAPRRYRPTWSSGLLGAGVAVCACGDVVHLLVGAERTYVGGTPLDATWLAGFALIALSAWAPSRHRNPQPPRPGSGSNLLTVPSAFALLALGVIAASPFASFPAPAPVLAVATVGLALGRTLVTVRDLRALHHSHEQARTDELTQLPNRRAFFEQLDARLSAPFVDHAVLIIDLNGFKQVNDSYGHHAGDELLRHVSARLRRRLPQHVALARLGGDEFGAVAPVSGVEEAAALAQVIAEALSERFALDAATVQIGASCGVALQGPHGSNRADLLRAADVAMYEAKRSHAPVALYDPSLDPNSAERLMLVEELRAGLGNGSVQPHYQPVVGVADGSLYAVEALARWYHPRLGVLTAEQFLPLVEQANLATTLTAVVLDCAVSFAAGLYRQGLPLAMSVNIGAADLVDGTLEETVVRLLATYQLPAQLLTLEIAETVVVSNPQQAETVLSPLAALGVRIAVDDFGTGRQPLTDLARLRVDELKLPRHLVGPLGVDASTLVVVESLSHLARRLGITLVGVGVEGQAGLEVLGRLGCDRAQGHLIGEPLDPHTLLRHLVSYVGMPGAAGPSAPGIADPTAAGLAAPNDQPTSPDELSLV